MSFHFSLNYRSCAEPEADWRLRRLKIPDLFNRLSLDRCAVGVTGLKPVPDEEVTAEVGYLFLSGQQGKGYGFESMQRVMDYAHDAIGLKVLNAVVADGNAASCRLLEKLLRMLPSSISGLSAAYL
ncbi:GNAT family N-acetyltransferase [Pseudomonas sp. ATCC PTA-122608]|uniref:GNAT family N-acetyltransferase n=1 Tax=unclassified Pseudomonas TaxID=196821 RepID=UPI0009FAAE71|nr:GNAT family N-acetyltransferase [Pseudomonas sp. ATCC PTA-122608]